MLFRSRIGFLAFAAFTFVNVAGWQALGADAEERAFNTAEQALQDGFYVLAEKNFAEFVAKHSASPRVAQALLRQSEAALKQQKFDAALNLLATNMLNAAGIADRFQFSIAGIYSESGQFDAAATNYAWLVARHTNSPLRLEATLNEARARFSLKQWPQVVQLLQHPAGLFQQEVARDPARESIVRGQLLLAEALLEQRNFSAAEQTAASISDTALTTKIKWQREFLVAKAQLGGGKLEAASVTTSNVVTIAATTGEPPLEAASVAMLGEILEALDRPDEALAAYTQNQRTNVPPERVREAVFKTVELSIAQGLLTNAVAKLNAFLKSRPEESGSDIALLTLAELKLKQHQLTLAGTNVAPLNSLPAGSDLLSDVIENCDKLLRVWTNSLFVSKAHLIRGWALLAQSKTAASLISFRTAANTLPWSDAQAVARFKTADLEYQSDQITNALRSYRRVLNEYKSLPRVQAELVPRARYQMLRASVATHDLAAAHEVIEAILNEFPPSGYAQRGLLLFAQAVDEMGDPSEARDVFARFVTLFPNDPLRPEAELAVARSFEREGDWPGAIAKYDEWVTTFPTNSSLPSAEYRRALANFRAGRDTNALILFTNFIARFPANALAARAQEWVGDFYFGVSEFDDAQRNYQFVSENWPATPLRWQARLKAGRAALLRPSFENAELIFTNLINDAFKDTTTSCPPSVVVLAHFAYGDALRQRLSTNAPQNNAARIIYEQVPRFFPGDPLVPRAWGAMADCYFQLGGPANYTEALKLYTNVTKAAAADIAARQQAQVGIGHVLSAQAAELARAGGASAETTNLLNAALAAYQSVIYSDENGESADPFWVKQAMLSAAEICKSQGEWKRAYNLYVRLADKIPPLRAALEKETEAARTQMESQQR